MLCSNFQHQANYAHHFVPIMLSIYSINYDNIVGNLHFMITLFIFLCLKQTRYNYTRLLTERYKRTMYLVDHLITSYFNLICQHALCLHNKTTYYAQSILYVVVPSSHEVKSEFEVKPA